MKTKNNTIDIIASTSSLICAIHCAAIPVVLSFSSLSSLHFLENPYIEWSFITLAIIFVFISLWPSYKRHHKKIKPLLLAFVGLTLIAIGRLDFTELWETSNTVIGATFVSVAHYFNWRILRTSKNHEH